MRKYKTKGIYISKFKLSNRLNIFNKSLLLVFKKGIVVFKFVSVLSKYLFYPYSLLKIPSQKHPDGLGDLSQPLWFEWKEWLIMFPSQKFQANLLQSVHSPSPPFHAFSLICNIWHVTNHFWRVSNHSWRVTNHF